MTSGTAQQQDLEQAMEHFGLGPEPGGDRQRETFFIIGEVKRLTKKTMLVEPIDSRGWHGSVKEFMREDAITLYFNLDDHALIELPWIYRMTWWLIDYELDAAAVERYREVARKFAGI